MPSFISNSNSRIPNIKVGLIWLTTCIILVVSIFTWNYYWYDSTSEHTIKDSAELWAYHRGRVKGNSNIVFIGSSRTMTSIDQKVVQERTKKIPVQLAIGANSPLPVLKNLAEDNYFSGIIISELEETLIYPTEVLKHNPKDDIPIKGAQESVDEYNEQTFSRNIEFKLRFYGRQLIAAPTLGKTIPDSIYNLLFAGIPNNSIIDRGSAGDVRVKFNRTLPFDSDKFTKGTLERLIKMQQIGFDKQIKEIMPNPTKFLELAHKIEKYVKIIQSRGGKVVFVSYPKNGEIWEINERGYPRKDFWNVFASLTSAKTVHFKDYAPLSKFKCPDGSHLDSKDAPAFTKELLKIIFDKEQ